MKIRLLMLGKTRREEMRALLDDYVRRIGRYAEIEITELRDGSPAALRKLKIEPGATVVLLDAAGKQFTSQQFARWLGDLRDRGTREIVFLCGDAEGFPDELRASAKQNTLAFDPDHAARIRARRPRRADLPRLRDPRRPSLPEIDFAAAVERAGPPKHERRTVHDCSSRASKRCRTMEVGKTYQGGHAECDSYSQTGSR